MGVAVGSSKLPAGLGVIDGGRGVLVNDGVNEGRGVALKKPVTVAVGVMVAVAVGVFVGVDGNGVRDSVGVGVCVVG